MGVLGEFGVWGGGAVRVRVGMFPPILTVLGRDSRGSGLALTCRDLLTKDRIFAPLTAQGSQGVSSLEV